MRYARVHENRVVEIGTTPHRLRDIFVPSILAEFHALPEDSPVSERWIYDPQTGEFQPPSPDRSGLAPVGSSS